jgi:hypothetical protein
MVAVLVSGQLESNLLKMSPDRNRQQKLRKELFMPRLWPREGDALSEARRPQDEGCAFILLWICLFIQRSSRDCVGPSQKIHKLTFKQNQKPNHHAFPPVLHCHDPSSPSLLHNQPVHHLIVHRFELSTEVFPSKLNSSCKFVHSILHTALPPGHPDKTCSHSLLHSISSR